MSTNPLWWFRSLRWCPLVCHCLLSGTDRATWLKQTIQLIFTVSSNSRLDPFLLLLSYYTGSTESMFPSLYGHVRYSTMRDLTPHVLPLNFYLGIPRRTIYHYKRKRCVFCDLSVFCVDPGPFLVVVLPVGISMREWEYMQF